MAALAFCASFKFGHLPIRAFHSEDWKAVDRNELGYPRLHMVDHLISSEQLGGKSKQEVISMLGPPTDTSYFSDWDAVYWLGPERGLLRIDSEWLVIRYDDLGMVDEYQLMSD